MYLCCVESLSRFQLQFFKLQPFLKMSQNLQNHCTIAHGFFQKMASKSPKFLLHFLIHTDVLKLCRKFESIPTSIFQVTAILKNEPKSAKSLYYSPWFFLKWLRNHLKFLLHLLIHIDVLMLCRKFEPIPTSIFQVTAILKMGQNLKKSLYYSPWFFSKK